MNVRLILWIPVMAWVDFFIAGKGSYLPLGVTVFGAVSGISPGRYVFSPGEAEAWAY
jgi:hypothetical protein